MNIWNWREREIKEKKQIVHNVHDTWFSLFQTSSFSRKKRGVVLWRCWNEKEIIMIDDIRPNFGNEESAISEWHTARTHTELSQKIDSEKSRHSIDEDSRRTVESRTSSRIYFPFDLFSSFFSHGRETNAFLSIYLTITK